MKHSFLLCAITSCLLVFSACKKDEPDPPPVADLQTKVLQDFSSHLAWPVYTDLAAGSITLHSRISAFGVSRSSSDLAACRDQWRAARSVWENSEAFLFGPVATENIDPRIDTWPVSFAELDSVLASSATFSPGYTDSLPDALKGFHPIEYLLFGQNGAKAPADFTDREIEFLLALSTNLSSLTGALANAWDPSVPSSFYHSFAGAGNNLLYPSRKSALLELAGGMAGICDEVANGKMGEPLLLADSTLEESPFSDNSVTDFTSNIQGVEKVYLSAYLSDGTGLEDFVRAHNLSLDGEIKARIAAAKTALAQITVPFGQAIYTEPIQVQNAIDAINDLAAVIDADLVNLIQMYAD